MLTQHRLQHIKAAPGEVKAERQQHKEQMDKVGYKDELRGESTRQIANTNAKLEICCKMCKNKMCEKANVIAEIASSSEQSKGEKLKRKGKKGRLRKREGKRQGKIEENKEVD